MEEVGGIILGHKAPTQHSNILQATFILREICHNSERPDALPQLLNLFGARWVTLSNTETCALCHTWAGAVLHYREGENGRTLSRGRKRTQVRPEGGAALQDGLRRRLKPHARHSHAFIRPAEDVKMWKVGAARKPRPCPGSMGPERSQMYEEERER